MKAKFAAGDHLYTTHLIIGTDFYTGCRVEVVESYEERGAETRYLVRNQSRFKVHCYESDLSRSDPMADDCSICRGRHGAEIRHACE